MRHDPDGSLERTSISTLQFLHSSDLSLIVRNAVTCVFKVSKGLTSVLWTWSSSPSISCCRSSSETFSSSTTKLICSFLIPKPTATKVEAPQTRPSASRQFMLIENWKWQILPFSIALTFFSNWAYLEVSTKIRESEIGKRTISGVSSHGFTSIVTIDLAANINQ